VYFASQRCLQVPTITVSGCGRAKQRPSRACRNDSSLASESLIIRPLRGSATACSASPEWPSTRLATASRSHTKTAGELLSRRGVPQTATSDNDERRGSSTTTGLATASRSHTKTAGELLSRRGVPQTATSDNDERRGSSITTGRHLDVFLPSLVARQTTAIDE